MNMKLERFSSESCPMNKANREMVKAIDNKMDDLQFTLMSGDIALEEFPSFAERERENLIKMIQEVIDYNSVDWIAFDAYTSHVIVGPVLPDFYYAVTNPRHMAYYDAKLKEELEPVGAIVRENERWWD